MSVTDPRHWFEGIYFIGDLEDSSYHVPLKNNGNFFCLTHRCRISSISVIKTMGISCLKCKKICFLLLSDSFYPWNRVWQGTWPVQGSSLQPATARFDNNKKMVVFDAKTCQSHFLVVYGKIQTENINTSEGKQDLKFRTISYLNLHWWILLINIHWCM